MMKELDVARADRSTMLKIIDLRPEYISPLVPFLPPVN